MEYICRRLSELEVPCSVPAPVSGRSEFPGECRGNHATSGTYRHLACLRPSWLWWAGAEVWFGSMGAWAILAARAEARSPRHPCVQPGECGKKPGIFSGSLHRSAGAAQHARTKREGEEITTHEAVSAHSLDPMGRGMACTTRDQTSSDLDSEAESASMSRPLGGLVASGTSHATSHRFQAMC